MCVVSTLWHIMCCFSLLPCCLVTGIEHAPWSWHRSTTFPSFPRPPRFHLDHSWGLYITRLARGAALSANLICARLEKAAKPGCAQHISAAAAQARRLGSWHAVCESRLPSTVSAISFCHLQKESQMLWHDKAARLARRSGYMGETKGEGVPPFCPRHAINEFLWRDTVSRSANLSRDLKIYRHKYDVICIFFSFKGDESCKLI